MLQRNQQNELWIYLSICWWLGSFLAWISAWMQTPQIASSDSSLTAAGLLVFAVSACLRLPVLTATPVTTHVEDHFIWLLTASANLNWLGYLGLQAGTLSAILPAVIVGLAIEYGLWQQVRRAACLAWCQRSSQWMTNWFPSEFAQPLQQVRGELQNMIPPAVQPSLTPETIKPSLPQPTALADFQSISHDGAPGQAEAKSDQTESSVERTQTDGFDAAGVRFVAGEVLVHWAESQRSQHIVIGFVPAMAAQADVELELDGEQSKAQLIHCTPTGMRIQLKRNSTRAESCMLSWYVRASQGEQATALPNWPLP